jgi:hypothetical protein
VEDDITVITNKYLTGKLVIEKSWSANVADKPATNSLSFTITGPNLTKTVTYSEFTDGKYELTDLVPGVYSVVENNAFHLIPGFQMVTANSVMSGNTVVTSTEEKRIVLHNEYEEDRGQTYGPSTGRILLRKTFNGIEPNTAEAQALRFRIFGPKDYSLTITYADFTDGVYTLSGLKPGQYMVYEENAAVLNPTWTLLDTSVTTGGGFVAVNSTVEFDLTNNYDVPTTSVSVVKIWDDMSNLDGTRPTSLAVTLNKGGEPYRMVTLSEASNWSAEIRDLPLFNADGTLANYSWTEPAIPGYTLTKETKLGNTTVLTNSHQADLVSVSVTKVWDDNNNEAGLRPTSLHVRLSNGSSYILNEANNWSVTVENLPKTVNGQEVRYTWSEQSVLGYTQTEVRTVGNTTVFVNSMRTPGGDDKKKGTKLFLLEEYGTPLGNDILINHVGDCFD